MGAFERVMGDQEDVYQAKHRNKHLSKSPDLGSNATAALFETKPQETDHDTPTISVTPKIIDFGLANVGARKSAKFQVQNVSNVKAQVDLRFVSKVVSLDQDELAIPPWQSVEVRVDFFPRRVNPNYRKQITVANVLNRANDEILEIRSCNVDEQKVGFHSLFYRILTSTGSNFIDFGDVNINCTRLRSFGIENVSKGTLSLELSAAQPEDLKLFVKAEQDSESENSRRGSQAKYAPEDSLSTTSVEAEPPKVTRSKLTEHLKERFLENISHESPASIRNENTSWRVAQKQRHVLKPGQGKNEKAEKKEPTKRVHVNMIAALKKGGKGRLTQRYGKSVTFKDRTLLREFEYLDLSSGPPIDGTRISVKSKKFQHLDAQETGKNASSKARGSETSRSATSANGSVRKLPDALANDIQREANRRNLGESGPWPALTGKRKAARMLHDAIDVSKLSLDELVTAVESQSSNLSTMLLSNPRAEEQSVRTEVNLQRELRNAINEGRLLPIDVLTLEPGEEKQVLAIYTPNGSTRPHIMGNARKQDSRIYIRLLDFNTQSLVLEPDLSSMLKLDREELPIRELMVKSNLCRSLLELSQPHINFGQMQKGETKMRKIVIQNRSEWALRYCFRKSGSIASGDIKIKTTDRYGVIPGHGKREVEFVFCPSLTGTFQERLVIENVADRDKDESVLIKANVARVSNFAVEPSVVRFDDGENATESPDVLHEIVRLGQVTNTPCGFVVSNLSSKVRPFVLHINEDDLQLGHLRVDVVLSLSRQENDAKAVLSKADEEEVETLSQKLKIASRKGQSDKIKKYQTRLTELGVNMPTLDGAQQEKAPVEEGDVTLENDRTDENTEVSSSGNGDSEGTAPTSSVLRRVGSTVTLTLPPQQSKRVLVRLRPVWTGEDGATDAPVDIHFPIHVHEVKNIDEVQAIEVQARVHHIPSPAQIPVSNLAKSMQLPAKEEGMVVFSPSPSQETVDSA